MEPSLLLIYAPWYTTLFNLVQAVAGVWLLSSGLEGYLIGIGSLNRIERAMLFTGGFIIAFPQPVVLGIGIIVCSVAVISGWRRNRPGKNRKDISITAIAED